MKIKVLLFFLITLSVFSQDNLSTLTISKELKEKANSVVRLQLIEVVINSQKSYKIKKKKIITVYNEYGLKNIDAIEYYSNSESISNMQATIYDFVGKEIKKIKRKDFVDQSVADGFSILSDNRMVYLDYTPTQYPFTIVYESEAESQNTAFIPSWYPIDDYYESIEKSTYSIKFLPELGFKYKESNFNGYNIVKKETENTLTYSVENLVAEKGEDYSPSFGKIVPNVLFSLEKFNLEGVEGSAKSWEEYGKLWYDKLIKDETELNQETIKKITDLTKDLKDPIEKAKVIYKYVQDKTRYVSIQLGIGGWKPMLAKDVDRLGYGDCKALSNYTRILLDKVGVKSYYTVIYAGNDMKSFDKDFVSKQGNHIILTLPYNDKNYFLECTSQTNPFAFGGDFTDDRYALMIKPEGGFIVKTNEFKTNESYQNAKGSYIINEKGGLEGVVQIKSGGIQYDDKLFLDRLNDKEEILKHYKNRFSWINGVKINSYEIKNNRNDIEFIEDLSISATNYVTSANNSIYFPINVFNVNSNIPNKYRNRRNDFEIKRGYVDMDDIEISLPKDYEIEFLPENLKIENKFGNYTIEIVKVENSKVNFKRTLIINKGNYKKEEYEEYRLFREQIAKNDNSKIVLTKKI
ncbi:MAG: DUF3857 domain-containing protein [Flavobacterium sp.]|nr:DUF3857 domain-containing protein [Flavobacterium sp.]